MDARVKPGHDVEKFKSGNDRKRFLGRARNSRRDQLAALRYFRPNSFGALALARQVQLRENWGRARAGQQPEKIAGLDAD